MWPAILLGAFAANVTTQGDALTSAVIALGNTAEGVLGAWLVRRFADGPRVFERVSSVFRFVAFSALEEAGVVEAIRYYQGGYQERTGIKVYLDLPGRFLRLPPEAERSSSASCRSAWATSSGTPRPAPRG